MTRSEDVSINTRGKYDGLGMVKIDKTFLLPVLPPDQRPRDSRIDGVEEHALITQRGGGLYDGMGEALGTEVLANRTQPGAAGETHNMPTCLEEKVCSRPDSWEYIG